MYIKINEALLECKEEVMELTLLDTLWNATENRIYRDERENGIYDLAERIAEYLGMEDSVGDVEFIIAEIIEDKALDLKNDYLDTKF